MFKYALAMTAALAIATINAPAFAGSANTMVGTWLNADRNTRGITRIIITESGNQYEIQAFGSCTPTDCDWGKSVLITYGNDVTDATHNSGTAQYNPNFAQTTLTLKQSGSQITLDGFTRFTDSSGRQNYHTRHTMRKAFIHPVIINPVSR
jgi:hypothetical protein